MNTLKSTTSFLGLRSISRPASPAPPVSDVATPMDPALNARGRVKALSSLTPFKRTQSPAPAAPAPTPLPLVQDGTYLQVLGLKLSEAVSRAVAQPTGPPAVGEAVVDGKRALPAGRGKAFGALIESEMRATEGNPHLHRAIIRLLQRPLSVLLSTLNANLAPLVTAPAFLSSASTAQTLAVQTLALSIASLAAEVLESFDVLNLGLINEASGSLAGRSMSPVVGDGLKVIRDGLESIVTRVVAPLVAQIKTDLITALDGLEHPAPAPSPPLRSTGLSKSVPPLHPSVITLSQLIPSHAKSLVRCTTLPSHLAQNLLATCDISLVWRAMVALASRPVLVHPTTPPAVHSTLPTVGSSPPMSPQLNGSNKKRAGLTPPTTPSASRFLIKLPNSRPPSPPNAPPPQYPLLNDAKAVLELLKTLPKPSVRDDTSLAYDAVAEALEAFQAFVDMLSIIGSPMIPNKWTADMIPSSVPTLIALPILLQTVNLPLVGHPACNAGGFLSVAHLLDVSEDEYREACLSGFGRANETGPLVAKRLLDMLAADATANCLDCAYDQRAALVDWITTRAQP